MPSALPPKDARSAWAAWTNGSTPAGSEFLTRVSSWMEGTAAQLARGTWHSAAPRPTTAEIQGRLRHHLGVVAESGAVTYLEALDLARRGVIEEILENRGLAR